MYSVYVYRYIRTHDVLTYLPIYLSTYLHSATPPPCMHAAGQYAEMGGGGGEA